MTQPASPRRTYGIMQGRLSPPEDGRFQSFPRLSWREEFPRAAAAGLDYIEWIVDSYGQTANPVLTPEGIAELHHLSRTHNIAIPAICGDWFMDFPLIRCTVEEREARQSFLETLLHAAHRIDAHHVVLPFVDESSIRTEEEQTLVLHILHEALLAAEELGVEIHLEADFPPAVFATFLARTPHPMLKVNWDSGNSSGLGFIAHEEFAAYGDRIGSVHIKDRFRKPEGGIETRPLGTGSADFNDVFASLHRIAYTGGVTLQVARGTSGDEVPFIRDQLAFVKRLWQ